MLKLAYSKVSRINSVGTLNFKWAWNTSEFSSLAQIKNYRKMRTYNKQNQNHVAHFRVGSSIIKQIFEKLPLQAQIDMRWVLHKGQLRFLSVFLFANDLFEPTGQEFDSSCVCFDVFHAIHGEFRQQAHWPITENVAFLQIARNKLIRGQFSSLFDWERIQSSK